MKLTTNAKYTLLSGDHGAFIKNDCMLGHKLLTDLKEELIEKAHCSRVKQ